MIRAYLGQGAWLVAERCLRLLFGAAIGILMARALGPGGLGHLSAAQAMVAVVSPLAALGLDTLAVRWLLAAPAEAGRLLGTLLATRLAAALLMQAGVLLACRWLPAPENRLVAILSLLPVLQTWQILDQYFQSRALGRVSALAQITALVACGLLRLALIHWGAGLQWFAAAVSAEAAITGLLLAAAFRRLPQAPRLARPAVALARARLRESAPLVLSAVAATLFISTDQLMLRTLAGARAVGIYAAAARLTEAWYALLAVLSTSLFPAIVHHALAGDRPAQARQMQLLYELALILSVAVAAPVSAFAPAIVNLLYGPRFAQSALVLVVHIWAGIFIGWRLLSGKWMLAEGLIRLSIYRSLWGLGLNLALAALLIPRYGVAGSAWAALCANAVVGLFSDLLNPLTRAQGRLKLRALALPETRAWTRARFQRLRQARA